MLRISLWLATCQPVDGAECGVIDRQVDDIELWQVELA
jgi:hypothetical protein